MDVDFKDLQALIGHYESKINEIREDALKSVVEWKYAKEHRLEWVPFWDQVNFQASGNEGCPVQVDWKRKAD